MQVMYPFVSHCFYAVFNKNHDLIRLYTSFFPQRTNATWTHVFFSFYLTTYFQLFHYFKTRRLIFVVYTPDYSTLYWIYFASTDRRTREANNCYFNEIAAEALCANYKNNLSIDMLVNLKQAVVPGCFLGLSLCYVLGISDLSPKCLYAEKEIILAQRETFGLLSESFDLIKVRETGILPNKLKLAITLSPVCFGGDGVTW